MQMSGKVLGGSTQTVTTKKGTQLAKARLKILDTGDEVNGDVIFYWVDFLGESALSESELAQVNHQEVTIEIRRVAPSLGKDGKAYVNMTGGTILGRDGMPVQAAVRNGKK